MSPGGVFCSTRFWLTVLSDLLLIGSLAEQLVWGSISNTLLLAPFFCLLLTTALGFFESGSWFERIRLAPLSLIFTISCAALITFIYLVFADERVYSFIFGEAPVPFTVDDLLVLLVLLCFFHAALKGAVIGSKLIPGAIILFLIGVIAVAFWRGIALVDSPELLPKSGDLALASILALLCFRAFLARRFFSQARIGWNYAALETNVVIIFLTVFGLIFGGSLATVFRQPLESVEIYPYKVRDEFLVMLFVSEDPIFAFHHGIDFKRIRDAIRGTVETGEYRKGGSTITMQLAKIQYLSHEKTLSRKLRQMATALCLEMIYNKEELIWNYINTVPFGPGAVGIESAARHFFASEPSELSSEQSLLLVLSIYNPIEFNPAIKQVPDVVRNRSFVIRSRSRRNFSKFLTQLRALPFAVN